VVGGILKDVSRHRYPTESLDVCACHFERVTRREVLDVRLNAYVSQTDPLASFDTGGMHKLIDSIGPEGAWIAPTVAHPLGKTTYLSSIF
jgi:hypothetical protein